MVQITALLFAVEMHQHADRVLHPVRDCELPGAQQRHVTQAERAGFDIHRTENTGVHYSITIHKWYENWKRNEAAIVAKYGQRWYRMWMMFLAWSVIVGGQGGSTVFMITMAKNIKTDKSTVSPAEAKDVPYSRQDRWIGPDAVATQQ